MCVFNYLISFLCSKETDFEENLPRLQKATRNVCFENVHPFGFGNFWMEPSTKYLLWISSLTNSRLGLMSFFFSFLKAGSSKLRRGFVVPSSLVVSNPMQRVYKQDNLLLFSTRIFSASQEKLLLLDVTPVVSATTQWGRAATNDELDPDDDMIGLGEQ
jgi:hypothetical protein